MGEGLFFASGLKNTPSLYDSLYSSIYNWGDYVSERKNNWLETLVDIQTIEMRNYVSEDNKERVITTLTEHAVREIVNKCFSLRKKESSTIGDKTTSLSVDVFSRIQRTFPESKIIFLHRNLYDFMASYTMHFYRSTKNSRADAATTIFTINDFLKIDSYQQDRDGDIITSETIKKLVHDWKYMDMEFERYKSDKTTVLTVRYEDIKSDPAKYFTKIAQFVHTDFNNEQAKRIVDKWAFDSKMMSTGPLKKHVNSRTIGYGKKLFSTNLQNIVQEELC